jgi:hypothetical protein
VFVPRGANLFGIVRYGTGFQDRLLSPALFDRVAVAADFAALAGKGYNTVRIFLDSCSGGPDCIGKVEGSGLNPAALDVITDVMALAKKAGIFILLTSNDLPDQGGYWERSGAEDSATFPGYRNSEYLTRSGHDAARAYWEDLMNGLVERHAAFDAVLAWSILNEEWMFADQPPLSLRSGTVATAAGAYDVADPNQRRAMVIDNLRAFIATVAGVIRAHDPTGLVTMGFFVPQFPNPTTIGGSWYVDTAPLVVDSALDLLDFHAYPGMDIGFPEIAQNFGISDAKPVIMGEVGAFIDRFGSAEEAGLAVQRWIAASCAAGFDGWLYWGYQRAPEAIGDATWGLLDADGYLMDALAPASQPDPCTPTLLDPNLAADARVTASRTQPGQPASNAVDGGPATWVAGEGPPQWIQVRLKAPATVTAIELTVAQSPDGRTVHRVEAVLADGSRVTIHRFSGNTAEGDVLRATFDPPIHDVVAIRVTTLVSPSWVAWHEIRVLGSR